MYSCPSQAMSTRRRRVWMLVERCVEETCHSLCGGSGTTCSLGDFCAISKVIILADNLTCRYRVQICLHSENQNETVCLLSYLSLYFQDYTVEWGCFDFFSLQTIWKDGVFLLQDLWSLMFCLPVRLLLLLCHVVKNHLPLGQEAWSYLGQILSWSKATAGIGGYAGSCWLRIQANL